MSGFLSTYAEFKSGYPVNVYLLILMPVILLGISLGCYGCINHIMTNLPIIVLLFYLLFSRHSNKVRITDNFELKIIYFFPWDEDITVDLEDFNQLYFDSEKLRCYDIIHLISKDSDLPLMIKVNMRKNNLKKLFDFIRVQAEIQIKTEKLEM